MLTNVVPAGPQEVDGRGVRGAAWCPEKPEDDEERHCSHQPAASSGSAKSPQGPGGRAHLH